MNSLQGVRIFRAAAFISFLPGLLLGVPPLSGSEYLATDDFGEVGAAVQNYVAEYGPEHVLLVVDIDNTLLAMSQELGSDQWFEWQDFLLNHEPKSPDLVATTFDGLLEIQGVLFMLGKMHPPEVDQPAIIGRVQGMGVATVVLTSRSDEFRVATERELKTNGYDFASSALKVEDLPGGTYYPYDLEFPEDAGLSLEEVERFKLEEPRLVSYENGIMMSAGQHKGAMLLTLLDKSERDIRAVVYADDHGRHVGRVFAALTSRDIEVTTFHYYREDERVEAFKYSDKQKTRRQWRKLSSTLKEVFGKDEPESMLEQPAVE